MLIRRHPLEIGNIGRLFLSLSYNPFKTHSFFNIYPVLIWHCGFKIFKRLRLKFIESNKYDRRYYKQTRANRGERDKIEEYLW
jgi:hypothetical protein